MKVRVSLKHVNSCQIVVSKLVGIPGQLDQPYYYYKPDTQPPISKFHFGYTHFATTGSSQNSCTDTWRVSFNLLLGDGEWYNTSTYHCKYDHHQMPNRKSSKTHLTNHTACTCATARPSLTLNSSQAFCPSTRNSSQTYIHVLTK